MIRCQECGKPLTKYEIQIKESNDCTRGWCIKCLKKADFEKADELEAMNGDY